MKAHDPRTVIAITLAGVLPDNCSISTFSLQIAEQLAHWLTMKAEEFDALDDRAPGYHELAQRLTAR